MPELASVFQTSQIGVESTYGVSVAANKLLTSLGFEFGPSIETQQYRPRGNKFNTVSALNKEWVAGSLTGQPTYTELPYLLNSLLRKVAPTTPGGGTTSRQWLHTPAPTAADPFASYTVEMGDATIAHKSTGIVISGATFTFSRDNISLSGSILGRAMTSPVTLTASPTSLALVPILPTEVSVFFADTAAGLDGAAVASRPIEVEWSMTDRYSPVWALNASLPSFADLVETPPTLGVRILTQANAEGMGLLANAKSGQTKFMRIKCEGPTIETTIKYLFQLDTAVKITDVSPLRDQDGVFAIEYNGVGVYDATFGAATTAKLINTLTAL